MIDMNEDHEPTHTIQPEPVTLTISVELLFERGLWERYCRETGMNEWARNEGQVRDGEMLPLTTAQAKRIGLLS